MRVTTKVFFKKITIRNKQFIPDKGPLIIVANHPSSFMDPVVIATLLNRKIFFLAKGEVFKSSFAKWILPKLNMIPVYRKQDDPSQMSKNDETFLKCYEHLENGGAILIFPEGTSITERKLRPIKTGAARILLGAEARNNFKLNSQIITIGLNYENPHEFKKDLFVNIEPPIKAIDYFDSYQKNSVECSNLLTEKIRLNLEKLIISIDDEHADSLAKNIELLYKSKLIKELGLSENDKSLYFVITKNLVETVHYFLNHQPKRAQQIKIRIDEYLANLKRIGLNDTDLITDNNKSIIASSTTAILVAAFGFPLYLFGLLTNYLPYKIPGWIADATVQMSSFRGGVQMVTGTFTFLIFYSLEILFCWKFSSSVIGTCIVIAVLPISGLFGYWYYSKISKLRAKWALMLLFYRKNKIISNLIVERENLILEFDKARKEYFEQKENL